MKKEELTGLWWLPNDPDNRVAGTLDISEDGSLQLRLIGSLIAFNELQRVNKIPIIVGSASGQNVTLLSSWSTGSHFSFPGTATSQFRPELAVLGLHLESRHELRIVRAFAEFDHLYQWVGVSGLQRRIRQIDNSAMVGLTYDYDRPESIEVDIGSRKIGLHFGYRVDNPSAQVVSIAESVSIEVEPALPVTFDELLEQHVTPLQNFVTLGVGEYAQLRALRAVLDRPKQGSERQRPVTLVFEPSFYRDVPKPIEPDRMLFTLGAIHGRLADVLRRWFDQLETLKPVVDLYFATMANRRMYLEHRFLNLVQAAETYHRKTNPRTIAAHQAFSDVRRLLCEVIDSAAMLDSESRQMFKSKLAYLNEVPLKERLQDLLRQHESAFSFDGLDPILLARKIGDTRNFLTHYDRSLESRAARGIELLRLGDRVQSLMELCFLRDLGIADAERAALVGAQERYDRA